MIFSPKSNNSIYSERVGEVWCIERVGGGLEYGEGRGRSGVWGG